MENDFEKMHWFTIIALARLAKVKPADLLRESMNVDANDKYMEELSLEGARMLPTLLTEVVQSMKNFGKKSSKGKSK